METTAGGCEMTLLKSAPAIWSEGPAYAPELMTKHTAAMLARRLEAYWRKRGGVVKCRVEVLEGERLDGRGAVHVVRSDMRNGCPR
jgi:hypothetical protein